MTLMLFTINKVAVVVAAATRHHQALLYTGLLLMFGWLVVAGSEVSAAHYPADDGGGAAPALAFCGDAVHRDVSRRLLYVSTLDGTVTALDLNASGRPRWSLPTSGGAPLLSSSIHRFELTNDGRMVRMIPSLYGGLYKFDGDSIEQIPVTADHLLSSSYKFSEDLVISGGKETRSYGVSARTGRIVYDCSVAGCRNHTVLDDERHGPPREYDADAEHDPLVDDIVVVRRETQTVRAVEPRTGGERWNFSVGHHQLELLPPPDCRQTRLDGRPRVDAADDDQLELRVLVPEGVVCAVRRDDPGVVVWRHKFDHPIVNAWRVNSRDELETVNLFSFQQFPVKQQPPQQQPDVHPSVYVGMYNRQLYIQESDRLKKAMLEDQLDTIQRNFLRIPWKPQYALAAIEGGGVGDSNGGDVANADTSVATTSASTTAVDVHDEDRATALSILYATEYANGNGFFLYTSADLNRTSLCDRPNGTRDGANGEADEDESYRFPFADDDTPTKIIIVSLWFWWKEIMVISLTTALILNVVLSRRLITPREVVIVERHVEIQVPVPVAASATAFAEAIDDVSAQSRRSVSESQQSDASTFVSRYQTDFDMLQCLGKGGFGVVFESKNKLDDCRYAIKRIQLPNRPESRDRVMREVKTLAHCEHQNIVRYFQAWVETPPPGWQEAADRIWMDKEALSHSVDIESPTLDDEESSSMQPAEQPKPQKSVVLSKVINRRERGLDAWITNLNTNECLNFDDNNRKTSFVNDDDSSFIQFREDSASAASIDCSYCGDSVFQERDQRGGLNGTAICIEHSVDTASTDEANLRKPSRPTRSRRQQELTNDSFQIVFQTTASGGVLEWSQGSNESTTEDDEEVETTTSGRAASVGDDDDDDDDDSFRIEFKHSTNGGTASVTADSGSGSGDHGPVHRPSATLPAAVRTAAFKKPRTFSENIDSRSCCVDATDDPSFAFNASRHNVDAVEPFRRTHRRPLSLDLTAASRARKEVELFSPNRMFLYIQMQLCKKQSLKDWLRLNDAQTRQRDIVCIFRQIVDGVEYCHLKGLIHRDLKPSNIFFALDGQIKIGDFGLVTGMSEMPNTPCSRAGGVGGVGAGGGCAKHTQQVGTHLYMSPEQLRGEQYSYKVDVYSLGVIFFELLRVFGTEMERIETLKALRLGVFPRDFACDFHDEHQLLKLMLSQSPDERPTTIGIRARPPLGFTADANTEWHFTLPPRRRDSHISGASATGDRSSIELSQGL